MAKRTCSKCQVPQDVGEFRGNRTTCRSCHNNRRMTLRRTDPLRELCTNAEKRAREKGFDFDVTPDYLRRVLANQDGRCYFFKVPLHIDGSAADSLYQVSLDRLDNARGYVRGNVALTCVAANLSRNKFTAEEFAQFCAALPAFLSSRPDHALHCLMRKLADPRPILVSGDLDVVISLHDECKRKNRGPVGRLVHSQGVASFVTHLPTAAADDFFRELKRRNVIRATAIDTQGSFHG